MPTPDQLLDVLPPFNNTSVLIEGAQDVPDIVREVLDAHQYFADDYDYIYKFFDKGTVRQTCRGLFEFCKSYIPYHVEGENSQTTKSPSAILVTYGDCKHYAGFIAGVLAAITRNTGKKIDCRYRFSSYSFLDKEPGHVFVVVIDRGTEIWIDPVLRSFDDRSQQPCYLIDKKIKTMPLYRVSGLPAGGGVYDQIAGIGIDPVSIAMVAADVVKFIKIFSGDKVPNYPISSTDTLNRIRTDIAALIPMPPANLAQAQQSLLTAQSLRAELEGDQDNVRKTYYLIYGEVISALQGYIATQGGQVINPQTGLPEPRTAGSFFDNNKTLLLLGGAGVVGYFLLRKRRRVSGKSNLLPIALGVGALVLLTQNKPPAVTGFFEDNGNSINCIY